MGSNDTRRIDAYLRGDAAVFREVDGWARAEIESRYPILHHELEDLCQTVHQKLLVNLRSGRFGHRSTLRTYVVGIAHYTAIDTIRKLYRERTLAPEHSTDQAARTPYESLVGLERHTLLHHAVLHLPQSCRDLWRLIFVEGLSYARIGEKLSVPEGTVKSRVWHCRRKALALLERFRRIAAARARLRRRKR